MNTRTAVTLLLTSILQPVVTADNSTFADIDLTKCYVPRRGVVPPPSFTVLCNGVEVTLSNYDLGWIDSDGCEVYSPRNVVERAGDYVKSTGALTGFFCPEARPKPVTSDLGGCEELEYCKYELDCDYYDYEELCGEADIFSADYSRNCLVVAELAYSTDPRYRDTMCEPGRERYWVTGNGEPDDAKLECSNLDPVWEDGDGNIVLTKSNFFENESFKTELQCSEYSLCKGDEGDCQYIPRTDAVEDGCESVVACRERIECTHTDLDEFCSSSDWTELVGGEESECTASFAYELKMLGNSLFFNETCLGGDIGGDNINPTLDDFSKVVMEWHEQLECYSISDAARPEQSEHYNKLIPRAEHLCLADDLTIAEGAREQVCLTGGGNWTSLPVCISAPVCEIESIAEACDAFSKYSYAACDKGRYCALATVCDGRNDTNVERFFMQEECPTATSPPQEASDVSGQGTNLVWRHTYLYLILFFAFL